MNSEVELCEQGNSDNNYGDLKFHKQKKDQYSARGLCIKDLFF